MAAARRSTSWSSNALRQSSIVAGLSARLGRCPNARGNSRTIALNKAPSSPAGLYAQYITEVTTFRFSDGCPHSRGPQSPGKQRWQRRKRPFCPGRRVRADNVLEHGKGGRGLGSSTRQLRPSDRGGPGARRADNWIEGCVISAFSGAVRICAHPPERLR